MLRLITLLAVALPAFAQCGKTVVNPSTGKPDCVGNPPRKVSSLPATCTIGDLSYLTTGTVGLYGCDSANTWTMRVAATATGSITVGLGDGKQGAIDLPQGTGQAAQAANTFRLQAPTSIATAYSWMVPGADAAGYLKSDGAGVLSVSKITLSYGCAVGDPAGSALATGAQCYFDVPMAGTIVGWTIIVDAGTATVDLWKIADGTAKPTVTNTITASAKPAISTGTKIHSGTLTGWTTSVAAYDTIGVNLDAVATAKYITVQVHIAH